MSAWQIAFDENRIASFQFIVTSTVANDQMDRFTHDPDYDSPSSKEWVASLSPTERQQLDLALQQVETVLKQPEVLEIAQSKNHRLEAKVRILEDYLRHQAAGGILYRQLMEHGGYTLRVREDRGFESRKGRHQTLLVVDLMRAAPSSTDQTK